MLQLIDYILSLPSVRRRILESPEIQQMVIESPTIRAMLIARGWVAPNGGGGPVPTK